MYDPFNFCTKFILLHNPFPSPSPKGINVEFNVRALRKPTRIILRVWRGQKIVSRLPFSCEDSEDIWNIDSFHPPQKHSKAYGVGMTWGSKPKKDGAGSASSSSSSISPSSKSTPLRQRPLSPVSVFHRQATPALPYAQPYKGLSTSITHIFTSPANTRVDCCALSCCGILQSDYNRYIILGKKAPTFKYRCLQHVLIPTMIFCIAGYCSVRIGNAFVAEVVCTALLFFCFAWIFLSCWRSTMKRSAARLELLRKVKGVSSGRVVESMDEDDELLGQSAFEMRCVHRFCGCYPHDCPNKDEDHGWSDAQISLHGRNDSTDFLAKLSRCFSNLCFGVFCKYHWQICGICALAQEGREIDSLVPREKRQLDYLTFQSYMAYYNPIRILRREQNGRLIHHYQALSKLSRMFLKTLGFVIFILSLVVLGFQPKSFKLGNLIVVSGGTMHLNGN